MGRLFVNQRVGYNPKEGDFTNMDAEFNFLYNITIETRVKKNNFRLLLLLAMYFYLYKRVFKGAKAYYTNLIGLIVTWV